MQFPLDLRFKLIAIAQQISVTDAEGGLVMYVKQKAFKLKESVLVYADEGKRRPLCRIEADRMIDFSATYRIESMDGAALGSVKRRGMRSIWRAHYEITLPDGRALSIREDNPWVKLVDSFVGEVPVLGMLTGYMLHPTYLVRNEQGDVLLRAAKRPSFFERQYRIEKEGAIESSDATIAVLGLLMMLLLERRRG